MVPIIPLSTRHDRGRRRGGVEAGVAGEDDPVAGLELAVADVEDGAVEEAGGGGLGPAVAVEGAGFGAGAGEQEGVAAVPVGLPPVVDGGGVDVLEAVVEDDAAVVVVGVEGGRDVAVAELVEGVDLPLFGLAAVDGQLGDVAVPAASTAAANPPPAAISGSWWWSPTRITLAPAVRAAVMIRCRSMVPAMPASSTTTTCRGGQLGGDRGAGSGGW